MRIERRKLVDYAIIIFLFAVSVGIIFNDLGAVSLFEFDEARHAQNALEMLRSGDWVVLRYGGEPDTWNLKPPLGAWLIAVSFKLFGFTEFAVRFWSAVAGAGLVVVVYFFAKEIQNRPAGVIAAALLFINKGFLGFHAVRSGDYDSLATFFICLSFYLLVLYTRKKHIGYLACIGALTGLTFMTKGWLCLSILAVIAIYVCVSGLFKEYINKGVIYAALSFFAVTLPWAFFKFLRDPEFIIKLSQRDLIQRFVSSVESTPYGWTFYFDLLKSNLGVILYVLLFVSLAYSAYLIKKGNKPVLILGIWLLLFLSMLTIAKTKLPWYVMPAYPAISILTAVFISGMAGLLRLRGPLLLAIFFIFASPSLISAAKSTNDHWVSEDVKLAGLLKGDLGRGSDLYIYSRDKNQSLTFYLSAYSGRAVKQFSYLNQIKDKKPGYLVLQFSKYKPLSLEMKKEYLLLRSVEADGKFAALYVRQ